MQTSIIHEMQDTLYLVYLKIVKLYKLIIFIDKFKIKFPIYFVLTFPDIILFNNGIYL